MMIKKTKPVRMRHNNVTLAPKLVYSIELCYSQAEKLPALHSKGLSLRLLLY